MLDFKFLPASTSDNTPFPELNRVGATALTADHFQCVAYTSVLRPGGIGRRPSIATTSL